MEQSIDNSRHLLIDVVQAKVKSRGADLQGVVLRDVERPTVTVIIPTLNEESTIPSVILRLHELGYNDVLIVDGNSKDRTAQLAKNLGAEVILQRGAGKGTALRQAFNHDGIKGDMVVMMDADGSMNPEEIPFLIETLASGADVVKGSRFLSTGYSEDMSLFREIGNWFFLFLVNLFWSADYTDLCYGFAVFKNKTLKQLRTVLRSENFEIETEVFIKAKKMGFKVAEAPSVELRRRYGKSNLSCFRDGLRILKAIFLELLTEPPEHQ